MRFWCVPFLVLLCPLLVQAQSGVKRSLIIFKDGFTIEGRIKRPMTWITDKGGASFSIPVAGGFYSVDDDVRNVIFQYDLDISPAPASYDAHSELSFTYDQIDEHKLVDWLYDRMIVFVKTYLAIHEE